MNARPCAASLGLNPTLPPFHAPSLLFFPSIPWIHLSFTYIRSETVCVCVLPVRHSFAFAVFLAL